MAMLFDAIKSLKDMKDLSKLQETIQKEMDELEAQGKLPAELKTAMENLKNTKSSDGSVSSSVQPLETFASLLEKYEDLFPNSVQSIVSKYENVTQDLEKIATRIDKETKK